MVPVCLPTLLLSFVGLVAHCAIAFSGLVTAVNVEQKRIVVLLYGIEAGRNERAFHCREGVRISICLHARDKNFSVPATVKDIRPGDSVFYPGTLDYIEIYPAAFIGKVTMIDLKSRDIEFADARIGDNKKPLLYTVGKIAVFEAMVGNKRVPLTNGLKDIRPGDYVVLRRSFQGHSMEITSVTRHANDPRNKEVPSTRNPRGRCVANGGVG